ncbi:3-oxoacyl-[acyl-carrier-protein] reductase [Paenibacillus donghaensis]|uniref:3-oxoacyl-[acyl-carrier-protein] reductase n=1 Tax=Paenibacillus donghaensis TaxID=414771 RepID=A0A2Z2K9P5_9BACL|nr:3-oxoacyl-[acyl-carrier-protein] reductase [Paenibacillus donghaensis]ASA20195.1 3-oxoacyl-[acyl-carrier-protein] reductase [Paenibacillus donghaensis]
MNNGPLAGQVALVTGGGRGIGQAVVEKLSRLGAQVAFTYRTSEESAERLAAELVKTGSLVTAYSLDVRDKEAIASLVLQVKQDFGGIDILVNNAGITADGFLMLMDDENWQNVLDTNLSSMFYMIRQVLPLMIAKRAGSIVNLTSVAGLHGVAGQTNYCAAKAGIIGLTQALSKEIAVKNIRVNAVAPGYIDTDMVSALNENNRTAFLQRIPMRRWGKAEEVANAVAFLASAEAAYISGQVLVVDGGLT